MFPPSCPLFDLRNLRRHLVIAAGVLPPSILGTSTAQAVSWGVAGHGQSGAYLEYQNISPSQQLDLVNQLGCTYYRGDLSPDVVNLVVTNSAYARIKIIPILWSPFSKDDIQNNPNGWNNDYFYGQSKTTAINWVNSWAAAYPTFPFDCVEIENELDGLCINPGASGSDPSHYNDAQFWRAKAIIQGLCDGVKAANPNLPRMVGCAGWLHYGFIDRLITESGGPKWERVVYHWYSNMGLISSHSDVITKLQGYATTYGTPTWVTEVNGQNGALPETGESTDAAERRNAGELADLVQDMKQFSFIHCICAYELLDEPHWGPIQAHYGLFRTAKGSDNLYHVTGAKPAMSAFCAAMQIDTGATYEMAPRHAPGMRLNVTGGGGGNGTNVEIYTDNNSGGERWTPTYDGNTYYEFAPVSSPAMRLDVNGASSADGTNVQLWSRNGSAAQFWSPLTNNDGSFGFEPECGVGERLDVFGSSTANGANVGIWHATGGLNQAWDVYNYSTRTFEAEALVLRSAPSDSYWVSTDGNFSAGLGWVLNSNAVGDSVTYVLPSIAAGTYDVRVRVKKFNNRGIVQLATRPAYSTSAFNNIGAAQDHYTSGTAYTELDLGLWTAGSTSDKEFRFLVTGKNGASYGYTMELDYIRLIPQ